MNVPSQMASATARGSRHSKSAQLLWFFALVTQCAINAFVASAITRDLLGPQATHFAALAAICTAVIFGLSIIAINRAAQVARSDYVENVCDLVRLDGLTGLLTRTFFLDNIRATGVDGVLLVADADHFKRINDTFGHYSGDAALVHLGTTISQAVDEMGFVGRLGGEEFGIFLPNADLEKGIRIAEQIRQSISQSLFEINGNKLPLTISIGLAEHNYRDAIGKTFKSADDNLYAAKAAGRNCVASQPNAAIGMREKLQRSQFSHAA